MPARFLAAALLAGLAAAAPAAPAPAAPKADDPPAVKARKALAEAADFKLEQAPVDELARFVRDRFGVDLAFDPSAVSTEPGQPTLVTVVRKGCKLRDGLRSALAPLGLRVGVTAEGLFVSTEDGVTSRQLRQPVALDGGGRPLPAVLKGLADETGAAVVLDPRLAKKAADAAVDLKLDDAPVEVAVRLAAEVAGLRTVRLGNVLFVTSDDRADKLRPDSDGPTPSNATPGELPIGRPAGGVGPAVPTPPAKDDPKPEKPAAP